MNSQMNIPPNWQLVPKEPTAMMYVDGGQALMKKINEIAQAGRTLGLNDEVLARLVYKTMLEVAPKVTCKFQIGDRVRKTRGSQWDGYVVGTYSTALTSEGYAVESEAHLGSVQIYPASALELVP